MRVFYGDAPSVMSLPLKSILGPSDPTKNMWVFLDMIIFELGLVSQSAVHFNL